MARTPRGRKPPGRERTSCRLAGDEFGILLEDIRDVSATPLVANRIQQKLVLPFVLDGHEVFITVSFGIVARGEAPPTADGILRDASLSMVRAKAHDGGSYVLFDKEMHDRAVHRLALEMDLRLPLDDFGTGDSSSSYLHRLPIDTLKVDRSFIAGLHDNPNDRHFVETIVHLAHKLGRDVICEGVELAVQADILAAMGVEYSQGFLHSRPVAAHEAELLIITGLPAT